VPRNQLGVPQPKVWYHGTDADKFDAFDASKIRRGSLGQGVNLTPDAKQAKLAGRNVAQVNIDVKNPLVARNVDHAAQQLGVNPEAMLGMPHDQLASALQAKGHDAISYYGGQNLLVPPAQTKIIGWK
jgi:hypothetical protein